MKYTNSVVKGFYPDPSVCFANGKFYMVCSSFLQSNYIVLSMAIADRREYDKKRKAA